MYTFFNDPILDEETSIPMNSYQIKKVGFYLNPREMKYTHTGTFN